MEWIRSLMGGNAWEFYNHGPCDNTLSNAVGKNMVNGVRVSDKEFKSACAKLQQQQDKEERNEG